jgi:hypothetical protein
MRRSLAPVLLAIALFAIALPLAACGADEEELDVAEGEPIIADDVSYNVVISRFLNPDDTEDAEYLAGAPDPPAHEAYFGVFMQIHNDSDESVLVPDDLSVVDTLDNTYGAVETDSSYALPLGVDLPAHTKFPVPDSTPAYGPIEGSLVLFLLREDATDNRPLMLELPLPSGKIGKIELDI